MSQITQTIGRVDLPLLRVLFFDVFGTCVQQRDPVANELWSAAREALMSNTNVIKDEIRAKAAAMTFEQWDELGQEWNKEGEKFVRESIAQQDSVDWRAVDEHRINLLPRLLLLRGLIVSEEAVSTDNTVLRAGEGSLWNDTQLQMLGTVWHRLPPWTDTCQGIDLLNRKYTTVGLSNTYNDLLKRLVKHSGIGFTDVYSSDMFGSFKPNAKVYLGAVQKLGVKPEECALVAAHLSDLKGAKACGLYAIYVDRPQEEKDLELRHENIPDLVIKDSEEGFVALAERLRIWKA